MCNNESHNITRASWLIYSPFYIFVQLSIYSQAGENNIMLMPSEFTKAAIFL